MECGLFAGVAAAAAEFPGELPPLVWFRARYIALAILQTFAPETPAWDNTQAKKIAKKGGRKESTILGKIEGNDSRDRVLNSRDKPAKKHGG